jgi:hypothetical protein
LPIVIVVGRKSDNKYDLIDAYFSQYNTYHDLLDTLKRKKVGKVKFIISKMHNIDAIKESFGSYFENIKIQCCMTNLYKRIIKYSLYTKKDTELINRIFSTKTFKGASRIIDNQQTSLEGRTNFDSNKDVNTATKRPKKFDKNKSRTNNDQTTFIFTRLNNMLPNIEYLLKMKPENRNKICTVNIITVIIGYLSKLLEMKSFNGKKEAIKYIYLASEKMLELGDKFIPNWDELTKNIE